MESSCDIIQTQTQLCRCLHGWQTRIFQFSSTLSVGKTDNCSFAAALIGGKLDFQIFFCSERRETGNCRFAVALIGGKVNFPVFLHSERRKTGNCGIIAGTYGGNLLIRFFIIFSLLLLVGGSWVVA